MKQLCLLLALLISVSGFSFTDPTTDRPGKISGTVIDKNLQQPLPYVTVAVKDMDGNIITGGVTDDNGKFTIADIPEGKSMVTIQYIGYKTFSTEVEIKAGNRNVRLGNIELEEDVEALDEVTVTAERTTIQQKLDRKVITVGKDLTTAGPTASDIMNNLPSVSVDQQTGALSLRGNQNVRVMVDGKFTNVPIAQLLKQIPSTSIKQIELITNPSAKYNPEGMSGIINIILHKNVTVGFNGNINTGLTYELQPKFNASIDMNYRTGKFNVYGNWGHNTSRNEFYGNVFRPESNSEQFFNFLDRNTSNLYKVGVDFYLNDKNTISIFTNQNIFDGVTSGQTAIVNYDNPALDQIQFFTPDSENMSSQYNFNYKLDFAKDGHNIELEADYNDFDAEQIADFAFTGAALAEDYVDMFDTDRERLTVNLDYVNPLDDKTKLELGAEARLFGTEIDYQSTQTLDVNGMTISAPNTLFDYSRDIYSAYATFGRTLSEKWSVQGGVRVETVEVIADTNTVRSFTNDYVQVYPSAFVTFTPSEKNQFQASYSRRIDRPGLEQVNPIREFTTPQISSFGNTQLQPQFTNSVEVNYTRMLGKGTITAGVFYRAIEDEINRALFVDPSNLERVILTYDNFDNTSSWGFEVSSNYRPTKWWSLNFSMDFFSQTQTGITERLGVPVDEATPDDIIREEREVDNQSFNARMINNFKVTKNLSLSAFGLFRGQQKTLQFDIKPMTMVNVGARYSLWEGRGTFSFNLNDIFNTMYFRFEGNRPFIQTGAFNFESNTWNVNLSYRFGGGKYRAKSRKRRDNDEKSGSGGIF